MKNASLFVVLIVFASLLVQLRGRGINPDELEHLHAACAVSWGELPYRDFFEHHTPALYYLLQPILRAAGPNLAALWWGRFLMWATGMATLVVAGVMARRLSGATAAFVAPALLCCNTIFFEKTIELRPDVPAMFLITVAALLMLTTRKGLCRGALSAGLLLGLATLFTQKAIVPAAAMIAAQATATWRVSRTDRGHSAKSRRIASWLWQVVGIAGGMAVVWFLATFFFWTAGGGAAFFRATVVQLLHWPVRQPPWTALLPTLASDWPLWLGAAAAVVGSVWSARAGGKPMTANTNFWSPAPAETAWQSRGRPFLAVTVILCFAGGLLIHAAYAQYYLLWFPLAAVLAADSLARWAEGRFDRSARLVCFVILAAASCAGAALVGRAVLRGGSGALPHFLAQFPTSGIPIFSTAYAILALVAAACILQGRRRAAVLCLAAVGFGYAGLRNVDALCRSNREQVAAVTEVNRLAGRDETVFDGFTGFGVFRPHAYRYWWINSYTLAIMTPEERGPGLLAALQKSPPKVVCLDENLQQLPENVLRWIGQHYRPVSPSPLWLQNSGAVDSILPP